MPGGRERGWTRLPRHCQCSRRKNARGSLVQWRTDGGLVCQADGGLEWEQLRFCLCLERVFANICCFEHERQKEGRGACHQECAVEVLVEAGPLEDKQPVVM